MPRALLKVVTTRKSVSRVAHITTNYMAAIQQYGRSMLGHR